MAIVLSVGIFKRGVFEVRRGIDVDPSVLILSVSGVSGASDDLQRDSRRGRRRGGRWVVANDHVGLIPVARDESVAAAAVLGTGPFDKVIEVLVGEATRAIEWVATLLRVFAYLPGSLQHPVTRRHAGEGEVGALKVVELDHGHPLLQLDLLVMLLEVMTGIRIHSSVHAGPQGNGVPVVRALVHGLGQTVASGTLLHVDGMASRPADVRWGVPVHFKSATGAVELHRLGPQSLRVRAHVDVEDPKPRFLHVDCIVVNTRKADLGGHHLVVALVDLDQAI
mmetsp:Transcript_34061/g.80985  ORF Transcript_34061/g.80985 Transcript_34061/m.80985 type:complete len:280 (+) Transcript_34061:1310-2149(+)